MVYVIPNGVYASKAPAISDVEKQMAKMELGLKGMKIALFAGWAYPPNYQAVEEILKISENVGREDVMIIVAGRAGEPFMRSGAGKNIRFTGYVDDLSIYFKAADIALNPMVSGGGTNIKMLDYFIWGLPVITTQVGARGLDIKDGEHAMVSGLEDFPQQIVRLLDDEGLRQELSNNCRRLVAEKYDWSAIARELIALYERLAKKE
jgi:glycosyltransferase involved in cell wall biosynthesis